MLPTVLSVVGLIPICDNTCVIVVLSMGVISVRFIHMCIVSPSDIGYILSVKSSLNEFWRFRTAMYK